MLQWPFFTYNLLYTLAIAQTYLLTFTCLFDPFCLCCYAPASNNSNNNATHQASPPTELESANLRAVGTRRAGRGDQGAPSDFGGGGGRVCLPHYYSNLGFQTFLRPWNSEYKRQMSEANFLNADISLHTRVHSKVFYYIVCNLSFFAAFSNFRCRGLDYELWQKKSIFNKLF